MERGSPLLFRERLVMRKAVANISRLRTIVSVSLKYGFGDLIEQLDLPGKVVAHKVTDVDPSLETSERIRLAFQELGPTFVKFGQLLSLRSEALPQSLLDELSRLQDDVAPLAFDVVRETIEKELGRPIHAVFSLFDETPLAAASVSQVHRAILAESKNPVAVKIQRPDVRRQMTADLDLLGFLADQLHQRVEGLRVHDLPGIVHVVRKMVDQELDFTNEARNMKIAERLMQEEKEVFLPAVYEGTSTARMLVMEYIEGRRIKDIPAGAIPYAGSLARAGLRTSVHQILEHGFFHADPHPGNLLIIEGGRICLIDWGMVGRLTRRDRYALVDVLAAIVANDSEELAEAVVALHAEAKGDVDRRALERDLMAALDTHLADSLQGIRVGRILLDVLDILQHYRIMLPGNFIIMVKALVTAEGTARLIDPTLDVIGELEPEIRRLVRERFHPAAFAQTVKMLLFRLAASPFRFPRRVADVVEKMERGDFGVRFEHHNLKDMRSTLEKIFSRLTIGIVAAAMIIGSSLIMTTGLPPLLYGYPLLGLGGYLLSALFGFWLIVDILRTR